MGLEYFPCYHSYAKKCEKLTDQELGRLFRALMVFSESGERQELAGRESIAFDFIADDIKRAKDAYEDKCRKNAINAAKRTQAFDSDGIQSQAFDAKNKNKDKDKEKSKYKDNAPKGERSAQARFTRPTLEEVRAYCAERQNGVDADRWFAYYEANGWRVGKNAMKDWKAAVRTWENNGYSRPAQQGAARAESDPQYAAKLDAMRRHNAALHCEEADDAGLRFLHKKLCGEAGDGD